MPDPQGFLTHQRQVSTDQWHTNRSMRHLRPPDSAMLRLLLGLQPGDFVRDPTKTKTFWFGWVEALYATPHNLGVGEWLKMWGEWLKMWVRDKIVP